MTLSSAVLSPVVEHSVKPFHLSFDKKRKRVFSEKARGFEGKN
jgi:hypothetical protein